MIGGGSGSYYYDSIYALDTLTRRWSKHSASGPQPTARRAHTAVLHEGRIIVFGGGNGVRALNDVWALDVSEGLDRLRWEPVETRGRKPAPRGYHSANIVAQNMVVIGGSDGRECFMDIWVLNLETFEWRDVRVEKEYRRLAHTSTQVGSYLFVLDGHDSSKYISDLLLFNLISLTWETRIALGRAPSARGYQAAFQQDSRLWVIGGFDGHNVFDDVYILDEGMLAYLPQVTSFNVPI